jgi:hypothetical protein
MLHILNYNQPILSRGEQDVIGPETYMNDPFMCRYESNTRDSTQLRYGCQVLWSYFGLEHGKGVHDGVGAILKQEIREEQLLMVSQKTSKCY